MQQSTFRKVAGWLAPAFHTNQSLYFSLECYLIAIENKDELKNLLNGRF